MALFMSSPHLSSSSCSVLLHIVLVVFFCSQFVGSQPQQPPLVKLFEGEWNLQISQPSVSNAENYDEDEFNDDSTDLKVFINVTYSTNTHRALYIDWKNDKNYQLIIEWDSYTSGELKYIPQQIEEEEEEEEQPSNTGSDEEGGKQLFAFRFSNRTNGYLISQGTFNGLNAQDVGYYQFVVTSPTTFLFTVFSKTNGVITVTGTKTVIQQETSFIQKYGFTIGLMALLFLFRLAQSMGFFASPQQDQPPTTTRRPQPTTSTSVKETNKNTEKQTKKTK